MKNQSNSVFNDSFEFVAPSEPGKYEVIAYLVHCLFKTMQSTDSLIQRWDIVKDLL